MPDHSPDSQRIDPYGVGMAAGYSDVHVPFLGPNPRPEKQSAYSKKSTAKWNMPEAYIGENEYLRDTVEDWMFTADKTFYTERIMPWYRTDEIHIQWSEWENNPHFMGVTPHQSVSNLVTQKRNIHRASILRRGIAFEFEHDFVGTQKGRASFVASLTQMARSVQETANVEIIRALLGCHRSQQVYHRKHGIIKDGDLDTWWNRRTERFMIAQKEEFGMEILNTQIEKEQEMYQGSANAWLLGREIMDYCSTVPPGKIFYHLGGQEAVDRINGRPQNGNAAGGSMGNVHSLQPERMVSGVPVFLVKSYYVDSVGQADLLSRDTEIGLFNTMIDRTRNYSTYKSASRNIRKYDADIDDWEEISLEMAITNCIVWDPKTGKVVSLGNNYKADGDGSDFLHREISGGGKDVPIQFIGELTGKWLNQKTLMNAVQTIKNKKFTGATSEERRVQILSLLGGTNNFFYEFSGATSLRDLVDKYAALAAPAEPRPELEERREIPAPENAQITSEIEQKHAKFLQDHLGCVVPGAKKDKLNDIVKNSSVPWKNRAAAIEGLILQCHQEDPSSISSLPTKDRIVSWVASRTRDYSDQFNTWMSRQQSVAPVGAGASVAARTPTSKVINPFDLRKSAGASAAGNKRGIAPSIGDPINPVRLGGNQANIPQGLSEQIAAYVALNIEDVDDQFIAHMYLSCPFTRETLLEFNRRDILCPANFLLLSPHGLYRTRYGIKCATGGKSGYMFYGHGNMQIEHDASRKVGIAHYTTYMSPVVTNPKNVYVVEDLFCEKYKGGHGTKFWSVNTYVNKQGNRQKDRNSIICTMLPPNMSGDNKLEKKLDVRGRWYTEQRMQLVDTERFTKMTYPGATRTAILMQWWDPIRKSTKVDQNARIQNVPQNYVCHQAVQFHYNTTNDSFDSPIIEQGHFGAKVYPGCGQVRNGMYKFLETPSYLGAGPRHF